MKAWKKTTQRMKKTGNFCTFFCFMHLRRMAPAEGKKIPTIYAPTGAYIHLMCMVQGIFSLLLKLQAGSMEKV